MRHPTLFLLLALGAVASAFALPVSSTSRPLSVRDAVARADAVAGTRGGGGDRQVSNSFEGIKNACAGGLASACARMVHAHAQALDLLYCHSLSPRLPIQALQPFDTIKTVQQAADQLTLLGAARALRSLCTPPTV